MTDISVSWNAGSLPEERTPNLVAGPGKKKISRDFGLFAGNPAVFLAGFLLVLCFKAGNPQITEVNQIISERDSREKLAYLA